VQIFSIKTEKQMMALLAETSSAIICFGL